MKDAQYITHDIGARNDPKLMDLQMAMGGLGLGIWWCLVEMLWENDGYLPLNFRSLAYSLKWAKAKDVERVVTEFGLFENDGQRIWNRSALERIQHKRRVSEARIAAGQAGGLASGAARSRREANANQMRSKCEANAEAINKLNNKLNNQDNISLYPASNDAEKRDIYRLFFFKNFRNPEQELRRFLDRYEGNWTRTGSTIPERDHMKLARTWKPEKADPRFSDPALLDWLGKLTAALEAEGGIDSDAFLHSIQSIAQEKKRGPHEGQVFIVVSSKEWQDRIFEGLDKIGPGFLPPYKSFTVKCSAQ